MCAWSEHTSMLPDTIRALDVAVATWSSVGIETPRIVTEDPLANDPHSRTITLGTGVTPLQAVDQLAETLMPTAPPCAATRPWPAGAVYDYLWGWLARTGGVPRADIGYRGLATISGDHPDAPDDSLLPIGPLVDRVLSLPPERQAEWAAASLAAMRQCSVLAPLEP